MREGGKSNIENSTGIFSEKNSIEPWEEAIVEVINTRNIRETDLYLRCLWAEIRLEFKHFGWNYLAFREGNIYHLGQLDIGINNITFYVSYIYKKIGTLHKIFFEPSIIQKNHLDTSLFENAKSRLEKALNASQLFMQSLKKKCMAAGVYSLAPISSFNGSAFSIYAYKENRNQIRILTNAYDEEDRYQESAMRFTDLLILLSLAFKTHLWLAEIVFREPEMNKCTKKAECILIDCLIKERINLGFKYDKIIESAKLIRDASIINHIRDRKAKGHFTPITEEMCNGIKTYTTQFIQKKPQEFYPTYAKSIGSEPAILALISALEVIANTRHANQETCTHCGQKIYKISQLVSDFCINIHGKPVEKYIKNLYKIRSKIAHIGLTMAREDGYGNFCNPRMIDLSSSELIKYCTTVAEELEDFCIDTLFKYIKLITS